MTTAGSREINVTPLIDVLLVLLIIFLVMMPIMLRTETIELPPQAPSDTLLEGVTVTLKLEADLSVALDDGPLFPNRELPGRLRPRLANAKAVFVDFVGGVPWSQVVSTVDTVRGVASDVSRRDVSVAVRIRNE